MVLVEDKAFYKFKGKLSFEGDFDSLAKIGKSSACSAFGTIDAGPSGITRCRVRFCGVCVRGILDSRKKLSQSYPWSSAAVLLHPQCPPDSLASRNLPNPLYIGAFSWHCCCATF